VRGCIERIGVTFGDDEAEFGPVSLQQAVGADSSGVSYDCCPGEEFLYADAESICPFRYAIEETNRQIMGSGVYFDLFYPISGCEKAVGEGTAGVDVNGEVHVKLL